jgi:hypothetical protein
VSNIQHYERPLLATFAFSGIDAEGKHAESAPRQHIPPVFELPGGWGLNPQFFA